MPMLLSELDSVCEGDLNIMNGIGFAATPDLSAMTKPFSLDALDDMFAADWDWPIKHEWDDMDELIAGGAAATGEERLSDSPRLSHDCMWSGTCFSDDHRENRTFHERKFVVKTAVKSAADPAVNCSASSNSTSASSNTSRCENNSSIAGSSSASFSTVAVAASSSNGVVNSSTLTVTSASSNGSGSSSSVSKVSNSNACVINSYNVVNSSINSSVVSSNSVSSSKPLVERTTNTTTCVSQKQTIQVPSVGGPRRAGVTVQKTVARSLLIKPTKAAPVEPPAPAPVPVALVVSSAPLVATCPPTPMVTTALPSLPLLPTTATVPLPTPVVAPAIKRTWHQPETPAESEDDPCPLDLPLPSVLLNSFNSFLLDNIKPPQGDLWDDVMAAVEEENAAGLIPETPPPSSKASSDSESCDENSLQPPATFPMMAPSTPLHSSDSPAASSSSSSSSDSPASVINDDHSYHSAAKYGWQRRLDNLGLQTPSDSEEEIDVVSTFERSSNYSSGRSSTCSSPGGSCSDSSSSSSAVPEERDLAAESKQLQLAATKLLSEASRAVSKRLRLKLPTTTTKPRGAPRGRPPTKRRLTDDLDDDDASVTRLPTKKAKAHGGRHKKSRYTEEFGDRRRLHNNMERMRRVDLRNSFEDLRGLVPSLMNKDRAPKVLILQDAANYCTDLKIQSKQLSSEVFALKKEQERLRANVSSLRRSLYAQR